MLDDFPNRLSQNLGADAIAARLQAELSAEVAGATITVLGRRRSTGWATRAGSR